MVKGAVFGFCFFFFLVEVFSWGVPAQIENKLTFLVRGHFRSGITADQIQETHTMRYKKGVRGYDPEEDTFIVELNNEIWLACGTVAMWITVNNFDDTMHWYSTNYPWIDWTYQPVTIPRGDSLKAISDDFSRRNPFFHVQESIPENQYGGQEVNKDTAMLYFVEMTGSDNLQYYEQKCTFQRLNMIPSPDVKVLQESWGLDNPAVTLLVESENLLHLWKYLGPWENCFVINVNPVTTPERSWKFFNE